MTRVESEISGVGCSLLRRRRPQPRRNYVGNDLRRSNKILRRQQMPNSLFPGVATQEMFREPLMFR